MHDRAHAEIEPADMPRASEPGAAIPVAEMPGVPSFVYLEPVAGHAATITETVLHSLEHGCGAGPEFAAALAAEIRRLRTQVTMLSANPQPDDWSVETSRVAGMILVDLGIGTSGSLEPGSDPRRDRVAARIEAHISSVVTERDARIAALEAGLQRFVKAWDAALEVADGRASFHYGHLKAIADTRTEWRDYEEAAWLFGLSAETR